MAHKSDATAHKSMTLHEYGTSAGCTLQVHSASSMQVEHWQQRCHQKTAISKKCQPADAGAAECAGGQHPPGAPALPARRRMRPQPEEGALPTTHASVVMHQK